jgi:hypothetical protein
MVEHVCHVPGCGAKVQPERLMCLQHWKMVPHAIRLDVHKNYRIGQCNDKRPSTAWAIAARRAIQAVVARQAGRVT